MLKQSVNAVIRNQGSHVSWNDLHRDAGTGSRNTVLEHAKALQDMLILDVLYEFDPNTKKPSYARNKKPYFCDPSYLHMFRGWSNTKDPFKLAEDYIEDPALMGRMA